MIEYFCSCTGWDEPTWVVDEKCFYCGTPIEDLYRDLPEEDEDIVMASGSRVYHRQDPETEEADPACQNVIRGGYTWNNTTYRAIKNWKRPCKYWKCFGEFRGSGGGPLGELHEQ